MTDDIFSQITDAIKNRQSWESKQDTWYRMRYTGVRRAKRPYPNAPDMHYPLIDTDIEKLKPFYQQQLYSDLVLATFTCEVSIARSQESSAEQWFDYQLKQCSNFERAMIGCADTFLQGGICPFKIYWDVNKGCIGYDYIDPLYVIVPGWTDDTDDADWIIHVKRMSKAQYRANKNYKQSLLSEITGRGSGDGLGVASNKEQDKSQREGLTYSADKDQVVIWECYLKQDDGSILIETIAPSKGPKDGAVRDSFKLPYNHGQIPFVLFRYEHGQKGWYASRGVAEIQSKHEQALNKNWNAQLQYLDFFGHPQYKNAGLTPINPGNFQGQPGSILPQGVEPVTMPSAPLDFQAQMQFIRALAEDRIAVPDLSASEHLVGPKPGGKGTTATQINAIIGLTNQSNDLRSEMHRISLGRVYNQSWELLKQFAGDKLQYIFEGSMNQLDPALLQYAYKIKPSGSADSWNKQAKIAQANADYQLLFGKPNVNQDELLKYKLESGNPRLVNRLYQDPGTEQMRQSEQQSMENAMMLIGKPVSVKPADDDVAHFNEQMQHVQYMAQKGMPLPPDTMQLHFGHATEHVNAMKRKKLPMANQYAKMLSGLQRQYVQAMQMQMQMPQQGQLPPMNGASPNGVVSPNGENNQPSESLSIPYDKAPPSIQRQIEAKFGLIPASQDEVDAEKLKQAHLDVAKKRATTPPPRPQGAPQR